MINEHLYFGTSTPTGAVSDEQWKGFLADAVTPRFPAGLTHWQASGQWRSADNIILENAYVLNILRQDTPDSDNRIVELTMLYKQQFDQESVLRVSSPACASL